MTAPFVIFVKKRNGEKLRHWLINYSLLNNELKIISKDNWLIFPLNRELNENEKKILLNLFEDIQFKHQIMESKDNKKPKNLFAALKQFIPEKLHTYIPKSFDIIGNLVIIEIPEELKSFEKLIGETLLELHPSLISVFKKLEPIRGDFRLRNLELLAGINNSETFHLENKCKYELDIRKVYFSPRLATEHARVCSLINDYEIILDMFAGIGPFSILIAKQKQIRVYAVDINPDAIYYLKRNIILNGVENFVFPIEGNIREILKVISQKKFNRIIMNLPEKSSEFLDLASDFLESEGIIHYYQFASDSDYPTKILEDLKRIMEKNDRTIKEILNIRKVRPYAPYTWQVGVDILLE